MEAADAIRNAGDGVFMIQPTKDKKPYASPQLTTISLRPEEAVLGACKSLNTGGHSGGSCLIPVNCASSNAGS